MIEAGKVLQQRYKIEKQIGQGGMGSVYVATDERFGSTVAIKETLCMDDNFRKAIEREARLLNSLKHTALPRVSDHFVENDGQFLVMEFIPGEDLAFILERDNKPFPMETVLTWTDQLLDALDFLHNQEVPVIHRDIKPQNLKVTHRGQIILLDFGLAKGNPTDAGHQTAAKSIFGYSRNYASLEQIQGTGTDPRSDLYSLAATLYHLSTGVPPEDALTRAMSVLSHKPDPLVPANSLRPVIPAGFAGVLQRAMDLNAEARPSTAAEMRQMFRESDNYAYVVENALPIGMSVEPQLLAQQTQLLPSRTSAPGADHAHLKTELLTDNLSQVTSVRSLGSFSGSETATITHSNTHAPRQGFRWARAAAAAAVAVLVVCGLGAGGLYVTNPSVFGPDNTSDKSVNNGTTKPAADTSTTDPAVAGDSRQSGAAAAGQQPSAEAPTAGERTKSPEHPEWSPEAFKITKPPQSDHPRDDPQFTHIPTDNDPGGIVVTTPGVNDKSTTTTTRVYGRGNGNGPAPQAPNQRPGAKSNPFPAGVDFDKMLPPEKARELKLLMRGVQRPPKTPNSNNN